MVEKRKSFGGTVKQRWWNSETEMVEQWNNGTMMVEQWNRDGRTVEQ